MTGPLRTLGTADGTFNLQEGDMSDNTGLRRLVAVAAIAAVCAAMLAGASLAVSLTRGAHHRPTGAGVYTCEIGRAHV